MTAGSTGFSDDEKSFRLPGIHDAASEASVHGQKKYMAYNATRLIALLVATVTTAVGLTIVKLDLTGPIVLIALVIAATAELLLISMQPERDWYAGRAVAESTKTLAWRFGVQGEPFGPSLAINEARSLLRKRVAEVLERGKDRIDVGLGDAVATESMCRLRNSSFEVRRTVYISSRTEDQQRWYSSKARMNQRHATAWRFVLLSGEVVGVAAAALSIGRGTAVDFAGVVAAVVAGGAAWLALKQHSQLTSAYRVASSELAIQADLLRYTAEEDWPQAVADAEEAISREHTMWLATRGEEPLPPVGRP